MPSVCDKEQGCLKVQLSSILDFNYVSSGVHDAGGFHLTILAFLIIFSFCLCCIKERLACLYIDVAFHLCEALPFG